MRTAIIDCGTNTFNLLIRESDSGRLLHNSKIPVRLGEGLDEAQQLQTAAIERGLAALRSHLETAREHQAEQLYAVGTHALRSASNSADFLAQAAQLGIAINLIDGQKEAQLIYEGVSQAISWQEHPALIMDIGGGSTEFILVDQGQAVWMESYRLGSSLLLNQFRPSDPLLDSEIEEITQYLEDQLASLLQAVQSLRPRLLIGSSGSFDTLAQLCVENFQTSYLDMDDLSYTFALHEYMQMASRMCSASYEERLNTPGMEPMRADMLPMATLLINFIIKRLGIKKLQQCKYALKEGLFAVLHQNPQAWQKSSL